MKLVRNFADDLAASHRDADWPGWHHVYRTAFPTMRSMVSVHEDGEHQRAGIDRVIVLASGKTLSVDEKSRAPDGPVYSDIALEVLSDEARNKPGWITKHLLADYIAYLNRPIGKCYVLPVVHLQSAWARHAQEWQQTYGIKRSPNEGYTTTFCPVPVGVLFQAIGGGLRVTLPEEDPVPF